MNKRLNQGITLRRVAELLDITPPHLFDLEMNRHQPPEKLLLDRMVDVLELTEAECITLHDMAAKAPCRNISQSSRFHYGK